MSAAISTSDDALARARVGVLYGGASSERDVSLVTGRSILEALSTPADAADRRGPRAVLAVEALAEGGWAIEGRRLGTPAALERLAQLDLVFLGLHGGAGEDGTLQGFLATAGVPFTGSGVAASAFALDKPVARALASGAGLRVAPGVVVDADAWARERGALLERLRAVRGAGWIVKPRRGGSSVATARARDEAELSAALAAAHALEREALVEAFLEGVELTGGVLERAGGELVALTPVEIRPHPGRFFDYQQKYDARGASEHCPPEGVTPAACERVRALALGAHRALGCAGYSRSDFLLPAGEEEPVFLELNTLPGFTPRSLLPLAAARDGLDFRSLCLAIAASALERARRRGA